MMWLEKRKAEYNEKVGANGVNGVNGINGAGANGVNGLNGVAKREEGSTFELLLYVGGILGFVSAVVLGSLWALLKYVDSWQ